MLGKEAIHPGRSHHSTGGDVDAPQQFKLLPMTTLRVFRRRNVANAGGFFVTPPRARRRAGGGLRRHRRRQHSGMTPRSGSAGIPNTLTSSGRVTYPVDASRPRRRHSRRRKNAGSIYNRPYEPTLDLLRHLDRARAVGLLRVAARVGPEAREALDAGAGPALRVRAAAVRELLALVAPARTEPFRSKTASKSEKRPPTAVSPGDDAFQWSETAADPQIREIQDTELRTRRRSRRGPARR